MNVKTNKKGFTLTEILIVLVIAGILLALILPNSLKAVQRGNVVSGDSNVKSCSTALMVCYSDNNQDWSKCSAADGSDLTTGKYLKSIGLNAAGAAITVIADPDGTGGFICK